MTQKRYDAVVVGAGPTGSAAAAALSLRGANVALLDANPGAARRFAGEWIHPTGVQAAESLGLRLDDAPCRGSSFVVFGDDGEAPVELPYSQGSARCGEHSALVASLREQAAALPGVDYQPHVRAVSLEAPRIVVEHKHDGRKLELSAGSVIGADGRASMVRRALGIGDGSTPLSYMASVELQGATLPFEGSGHVFLGGPGPALFYRISGDCIRGCLDVPLTLSGARRDRGFLYDGFAPRLPPPLRPALRRSLEAGPVRWAVTRFRPRTHFGSANVWLAGDAAGHVHPLSAIGLTMGFLDAAAMASAPTLDAYARQRSAYVPELLANVLYGVFMRHDPSAVAVRRALLRMLRGSDFERRRTMRILTTEDDTPLSFATAFLRTAGLALDETVRTPARAGRPSEVAAQLGALLEWLQWPVAALWPRSTARRERSSWTHPLPGLRGRIPSGVETGARSINGNPSRSDESKERPSIEQAADEGVAALVGELERIARLVGSVPDADLAGPALGMILGISAGPMKAGNAARMALARRRLGKDGVARLLTHQNAWPALTGDALSGDTAYRTEHIAHLIVALLARPAKASNIEGARDAVSALLARQLPAGRFAQVHGGPADLGCTAAVCRALSLSATHFEDDRRRCDEALDKARAELEAAQLDDGSWRESGTDSVSATALALESITCAGGGPTAKSVQRATEWLLSCRSSDGSWSAATSGAMPARALATARALRALLAAGTVDRPVLTPTAEWLASAIRSQLAAETAPAPLWELVEALGRFRQITVRREGSPIAPRRGSPSRAPIDRGDWRYCRSALRRVSRTFSEPIALLPNDLEVALSVGYLLCRIADTIEDHPRLELAERDRLFSRLIDALGDPDRAHDPGRAFFDMTGDGADVDLARNASIVFRVFAAQPADIQAATAPYVVEMAQGMRLYTRRPVGPGGVIQLYSVSDLERYCYFVAGTVGRMVTDLFSLTLPEQARTTVEPRLLAHCEAFGLGLQMVNILKDVTDDLHRGWCYLPRTLCHAQGIRPLDLIDPSCRRIAHAAVAPLFQRAAAHLDEALKYTLAVPPNPPGLRLFCLLPLWMAVRTLVHARGNDAMFTPARPVKISRTEVAALIAECRLIVADDRRIGERYEALWGGAHPIASDRRSAG